MSLNEHDIEWAKGVIRKIDLFAGCSEDEIKRLVDGLDKKTYKSGATILFQGEISSRLYLVETGNVSINVRKGKDKIKVAELPANSYFGEISLLRPRAATATVKAESDTDIVFLPGEVVQELVKSQPALAETINAKIEERLKSQVKKDQQPAS